MGSLPTSIVYSICSRLLVPPLVGCHYIRGVRGTLTSDPPTPNLSLLPGLSHRVISPKVPSYYSMTTLVFFSCLGDS